MRVLKKNRGVIAYLVLVIGVVTLRSAVLLAKSPDIAPGSQQELQVTDKMAQPPMNLKDQAMPMLPGPSTNKVPPSPMGVNDQAAMPMPPGPANNKVLPPPMGVNDQAVMPNFSGPPMDRMGPPPGMMKDQPAMPHAPMPQVAPDNAPPFVQQNEALLPPETVGNPPTRRPGGRQGQPTRMRPDRQGGRGGNPASKSKSGNAANEEDIFKVVPQTCTVAKGQFIWNFEDEELINILRQVSDLLCRTIVAPDAIGKNLKMTIIGKSPLTPKDAWDVLMASLAAKGLAMIEQGKTWTVVKRNESKSYSTPMYFEGKQARNNEEIGTLFYKAQHASQDALKNIAKILISKDGMVDSIGEQYIIVIDSNSNIRRLGSIFSQIDIEDAINKIHIISLLNADAKTIEKQLRELFDVTAGPRAGRRRAGPSESKSNLEIDKIIADERTNSLIIVSDKESLDKLKEVVALMDIPAADQSSKGKIHVKKLRFADAKKIAETLTNVVQQGKSSRYSRRRAEEGTNELFEGEVKVTAHESTNTLVTVASPNDYRSLLATINSLDTRKEQVYVEAVILDIQVNDNNDFGINLFGGLDPNWLGGSLGMVANPGGAKIAEGIKGSLAAGAAGTNITGLGNNSIGALAVLGNFLSGGVVGIAGKPIPGTQIPSFGVVLQALTKNNQVDVLSTPYLLTTDNTEAEMSVGEKVPVVRGTSSVGGGGIGAALGVPMQNIAYEDVKLTFKITPHVGADDNVRLDIHQEVNELGGTETILNQNQYRIRTKSAKTTLVLKDQQTGVIGGLIGHKTAISDNKVPLLGDIPILGWLFKSRNTINERKNLLLIITPYVIRTDEDYKKIVDRKLKEREEFAQMYYGGKIKNYNKFIDYDKKAGPLSSLLLHVNSEMSKAENGGSGSGSETIITPKETLQEQAKEAEPNKDTAGGNETASLRENDFILDEFDSGPGGADGSIVPGIGGGPGDGG